MIKKILNFYVKTILNKNCKHNNNFQNLVKINENFKKINKSKITNNNIELNQDNSINKD